MRTRAGTIWALLMLLVAIYGLVADSDAAALAVGFGMFGFVLGESSTRGCA